MKKKRCSEGRKKKEKQREERVGGRIRGRERRVREKKYEGEGGGRRGPASSLRTQKGDHLHKQMISKDLAWLATTLTVLDCSLKLR